MKIYFQEEVKKTSKVLVRQRRGPLYKREWDFIPPIGSMIVFMDIPYIVSSISIADGGPDAQPIISIDIIEDW